MYYSIRKRAFVGLAMVGLHVAIASISFGFYDRIPKNYLPKLSNINATESAQTVYQYLASRRDLPINGAEPKAVVGQHLGGVNEIRYGGTTDNNGNVYRYFDMNESVYVIDGKRLGFVGTRYDTLDKKLNKEVLDLTTCQNLNTKLIAMWKQHQPIIQITAGPRNPWQPGKGRWPADANIPGSKDIGILIRNAPDPVDQADIDAKAHYWMEMDIIATALQQFEDAGVPVILRPFAEFNQTNKYYWKDQSSDDFKNLWNDVYDYYVNFRGLNNLIFCWEVWALHAGSGALVAPFYPGPGTVDLVAGAFYFEPMSDYLVGGTGAFQFPAGSNDLSVYNFLASQTRPFGVAQYGVKNDTGGFGDNAFTLKFMTSVQDCAFIYYWFKEYDIKVQANAVTFMNDGDVATAEDLPPLNQQTFYSEAVNDGWALESNETSSVGGTKLSTQNPGLITGDSTLRQQYRSIVSFNTMALPDLADRASVTLRLKRSSLKNTTPFNWGGALTVDIKGGLGFSSALSLVKGDFEAPADANGVIASMSNAASDGTWSTGAMNDSGRFAVDRSGTTQLRVRFTNGNNLGGADDYIIWYSGESAPANKPQLVVKYKYQ